MWARHEEIEKDGRELIFIGNGPSNFIKTFKEDLKIVNAKIYTDPSLKVFEAAGLKRGKWETLGPLAIFNAVKLYLKGFRQKEIKGDPWQQGGVLIIQRDGKVVYKYVNRAVGDEAPIDEILRAGL